MKLLTAVLMTMVVLSGCASGSYILIGEKKPTVAPEKVKLYFSAPDSKYEVIGIVEASSEVGISSQAAQDRAVKELKKQAGKLGANGVILGNCESKMGETGVWQSYGNFGAYQNYPYEMKTLKGQAVFVKDE